MPTTRKQKKARKSRGLEILSDIENLDIMLGENHFDGTERDESLEGTSIRRQESVTSNNLENEGLDPYADYGNPRVGTSAVCGQNSASVDSQAEINKLSSELNSRISREMDEMMNSVSSQIQRAINDAINNQVLPQIQNVIMAGSGQETRRGWETSFERPEVYSEIQQNPKAKTNFSSEHSENHRKGDGTQRNVLDSGLFGDIHKLPKKSHNAEKLKLSTRPVLYVTLKKEQASWFSSLGPMVQFDTLNFRRAL